MKKVGGIISLIAGICGTISAMVTLFSELKTLAFNSGYEPGSVIGRLGWIVGAVTGLGWGGVAFSFLVIVFAAVAISAKGKIPGALLIISSVFGALLGGTLVAVFMVLALIGGILATSENKLKVNN